jgi:hypothetical protein
VYVTGTSRGGAGTGISDFATIKYTVSGGQVWVARYDGPYQDDFDRDEAADLAVDSAGNVFVTGNADTGPPSVGGSWRDFATLKYAANGSQLWVRRFDAMGFGNDEPAAIAVDTSGNVYVAGTAYWGSDTYDDYATIKYDPSGNRQWVARYTGPTYSARYEETVALEVDGAGNAIMTGYSDDPIGPYSYDYATIKYSPTGAEPWIARYNGPANGFDQAQGPRSLGCRRCLRDGRVRRRRDRIRLRHGQVRLRRLGLPDRHDAARNNDHLGAERTGELDERDVRVHRLRAQHLRLLTRRRELRQLRLPAHVQRHHRRQSHVSCPSD